MSRDDQTLPFEAEIERIPRWIHSVAVSVVVVSALVAARVVPITGLLPFLVLSSIGRRFTTAKLRVEVGPDTLVLGTRKIPRAKVVDVWVDEEPRVTVAFGDDLELVVLHFQDEEHAQRFVDELVTESGVGVAGYRPRWVDLLSSLRFLAIAIALFATGGKWIGVIAVPFFSIGLWSFGSARQLVARGSALEARSAWGTQPIESAAEIRLVDPLLNSPGWLARAKRHAIRRGRNAPEA